MNSRQLITFVTGGMIWILSTVCISEASTLSFVGDILSPSCIHQNSSSTGIASVSDTCISSGAQLTASAVAVSSYGRLGVGTFADYAISGTPLQHADAFGIGMFSDDITISFGPLNGSQGVLFVNYSLDGTITNAGLGVSVVQVAVDVRQQGVFLSQSTNEAYTSSTSGSFRAPAAFTFVYGQPFTLSFCLGSASGREIIPAVLPSSGHITTAQCSPGISSASTGSGKSTASFFNTLTLTGLIPTDSSGSTTTGATFSSASGTQYGINGVVIPEPTTLLLSILGTGIAGLAYKRRWLPEAGRKDKSGRDLRS